MVSTKRGAAQIGLIWIISFGVIALVAIFFGYVAQDDRAMMRDQLAEAEDAAQTAEDEMLAERDKVREISTAAGGYDRTSASAESDPQALRDALDTFRQTFTQVDSNVDNVVDALLPAAQAYRTKLDELANKEGEVQRLQSEVATLRQQRQSDVAAKDDEIQRLASQLSDEQANASDREDELNRRLGIANAESNDLDQQVRQLEERIEELTRGYDSEIASLRSRLTEQGEKLGFLAADARELPDAEVLSVSPELGLGFINIGANNRLARGVAFRIMSPEPGSTKVKAMAEVIDVEADMAQVQISGVVDPFDPVVPGDVLINELYDPTGLRNAVLIGRFGGAFDEGELRALLDRMGIRVQDELSLTTDYAIVGSEMYVDEYGEAYEEPVDPSELPVYSEAVALGVKVIPIQQVREFFIFE
ncbi:MAG: hypothetical protein ACYTFV_10670 [Planctomycetota bacterium]|jgi:predicted  nucleic acid-binding Zn-ribbon protein